MQTLLQDLRYGARMLLKNPGFTLIAVITLALGIGANTAIFSVVDKLLVRSLPVKDPQQLALVSGETVNPKFMNNIVSYPDYVDYRDQNEVFSGLLAFTWISARLGEGEQSDKLMLEAVSGSYFSVLGVAAAQGRLIQDDDNRNEDAHPVAVISHGCWQRRLGGKPNVVGETLRLNGMNYTIIGVAPAGFSGMRLEGAAEAWVPLMMRRQLMGATTSLRKGGGLRLLGRLKPGIALAQAQVSFDLTARRIWEANTAEADRKLPFNEKRMLLEPGGQGISSLRRGMGDTLNLLVGIVVLLLVLACANVANLLVARATSRQKESHSVGARRASLAHRAATVARKRNARRAGRRCWVVVGTLALSIDLRVYALLRVGKIFVAKQPGRARVGFHRSHCNFIGVAVWSGSGLAKRAGRRLTRFERRRRQRGTARTALECAQRPRRRAGGVGAGDADWRGVVGQKPATIVCD
jgi:predicted permease